MSSPLLTTKLYAPPVRPELVSRSRLTQRLDAALSMGRKLTLLSAPAGFGKTTLLSEWAHSRERSGARPVAWLSLDRDDSGPTRFVTYVIAALQTFEGSIGSGVQEILRSPQPPIDAILTSLINEIAAIPGECVLVLDDYHLIDSPRIYDAVIFLVDHLPPNMHLVIATRRDPRLPLPRLRAAGQVDEMRGRDLRFTEGETTAFLNQAMGLDLTAKDVAALATRTEGWIAGLQLAALSLQGEADRGAFIRAFAGDDRYVMDYLVNEVLSRQSEAVRRFLLHTAILERFCAPLCDAVLGGAADLGSSQQVLEYLEEANLFVVPLDHRRQWYRYHHLFGDLLRHRLRRTLGDGGIASLHRRASAWYAREDMRSEAIAHSLAARDWEQAAELIEQAMNDMMRHGEFFTTMLGRLKALPAEVIRARPHFGISYAWLLQITLQLDEVEPRLQEVEKTGGDRLSDDLRLEIDVIRASLARQRRDVATAMRLSEQVLDALPANAADDNPLQREARTGAVSNLGHTYFYLLGDVIKGGHYYAEALALSRAASSLTLTLAAMSGLAQVQMVQGQLDQAVETYRQGLALVAHSSSAGPAPAAAYMHIGLGGLLQEQNELDKAARHLAQGLELCRQWQIGDSWCDGLLFQARLKQAQGDTVGALNAIQRAEGLSQDYQTGPRYGGPVAACRALLALRDAETASQTIDPGRLRVVEQWVEARGLGVDGSIASLDDEFEYLVWARLLIAQGRPNLALRLLARLLAAAEEYGRSGRAIEMLALQSLAHQACGDVEQALATLEQALTLAEPGGYVRTFVDEGAPMFELLRLLSARRSVVDTGYIGTLLDAFGPIVATETAPRPEPESRHLLLDPLTEREMEVLRLLRTDLSVPEIAQELYISVNTVKTHVKRIYSKLGAHSRYEAVERARELDLI